MSLAKALKKAASASLAKLGGDVTIRQVTAGAYNTTTGAITESTSDTTIKGASVSYTHLTLPTTYGV